MADLRLKILFIHRSTVNSSSNLKKIVKTDSLVMGKL
jgi:hypothetical protein